MKTVLRATAEKRGRHLSSERIDQSQRRISKTRGFHFETSVRVLTQRLRSARSWVYARDCSCCCCIVLHSPRWSAPVRRSFTSYRSRALSRQVSPSGSPRRSATRTRLSTACPSARRGLPLSRRRERRFEDPAFARAFQPPNRTAAIMCFGYAPRVPTGMVARESREPPHDGRVPAR